jgi:hypothetical protein
MGGLFTLAQCACMCSMFVGVPVPLMRLGVRAKSSEEWLAQSAPCTLYNVASKEGQVDGHNPNFVPIKQL